MKKILLCTSLLLAASAQTLMAVPARRGIIKTVTQPDGTELAVKLVGDERSHCYTTTDDMPLLQDATGRYCYATISTTGIAEASSVVARNVAQRSADDNAFIATLDAEKVGNAVLTRQASSPRRANQSTEIGLSDIAVPHSGDVKALVILVEFSDKSFSMSDPLDYYEDFLNGENFTQDNGTGSCRKFYMDSSNNQFRPTFEVYGPAKISSMSTYGANDAWGNDKAPEQMVVDACKKLDSTINYADYDTDGDGYVDNIYFIYAGQGEASYGSANTIWPHQWTLTSAGTSLTLDGKKIDRYGCCNEYDEIRPSGIGTFCHEFGHVLGLPDLYDTVYGSATKLTPGSWSVMDYASYNNDGRTPASYSAFERNAMGWVDPIVLGDAASISLENIHDTNQCAIVLTSKKNEFFLFENRQQTGWDKYLPGHGMLVWHIDFNQSTWTSNVVNNTSNHQYVDIEEANGKADNTNSSTMAGYTFPGTSRKTTFTDSTSPSMKTWSGTSLNTPITNITEKNGIIYFDVNGGMIDLDIPVVTISDVNGAGFTVEWEAVEGALTYVVTVSDSNHEVIVEEEVEGTSYTATRLQPETMYYVTVAAKHNTIISEASQEADVTTGQATFDMLVPIAEQPLAQNAESFTASWQPVEGAADYLLTVLETSDVQGETVVNDFGSTPEGWSTTATGSYSASSKGYFGESAPALKMSSNLDKVTTKVFDADIVEFSCWARLAGVTAQNYFEVQVRPEQTTTSAVASDDETWELVHTQIVATTGTTYTITEFPKGSRQLRLVFYKESSGNMALDDMTIKTGGDAEILLDGYDNREVGNVTSHTVGGLRSTIYTYTVVARDANGTLSQVSDPITVDLTNESGIATIETSNNAEAQLYNLQGVRVFGTPAPGLYIRRSGSKVEKVIIR